MKIPVLLNSVLADIFAVVVTNSDDGPD